MSAADGSAAPHFLIAFLMDGYFYLSAALAGVQTPYGCTNLLIFIAITIVMGPFFLLSVWVEKNINFNLLKSQDLKYAQIKRINFQANAMSYLFLIIATFISVIFFGEEESFYRVLHKLSFFS
jgi:hypothetical protein